ncbi:hypothetical protein [Dysosmobacter sp.]|uniref:hypothetical protein n=1 Tax=Dysosmobacter sp. TaxID=2591382 RepID=UPI002A84F461|nr:hypothetical protein [Dysosmobacter sp.]MDY3281769.1 hypothetical protein [Dysosmobacter sp.]
MTHREYREAFDRISFSPDFPERTEALLRRQADSAAAERNYPMNRTKKTTLLIAAAIALLTLSVSAALVWLTPAQVAERTAQPLLAAAFESDSAVVINESRTVGDCTVTLSGLVSGADLSRCPAEYNGELISDRTYAVFSLARTDGQPLEELPDSLSYSPLVSGYHVRAVNSWTLGAGCQSFVEGGVAYYLYDTRNLEMFADHTVYFAVYEGGVPSPALFPTVEDGTISLAPDVTGALFTLPLDPAQADPAAAEAFVEATGLEFIG